MSCIDSEAVFQAVGSSRTALGEGGENRSVVPPATLTPEELQEVFRHQLDAVCRVVEEQLRTLTLTFASTRTRPLEPQVLEETVPVLPRADGAASRPLTDGEAEIWLAAQFGADANAAMTEIVTLRLEGPLDAERLLVAVRSVLGRHGALRSRFSPSGETVRIDPAGSVPVRWADLSREVEPEAAFSTELHALAGLSFDPVAGPVARADLVRLGERLHVLALSAHHIACDGWSFAVLAEEIASAYRSGPERLAPATQKGGGAPSEAGAKRALDYWAALYASLPEPLDLPADHPRPKLRGFAGDTRSAALPPPLVTALKALATRQGQTLTATMLAAFQVLLARLSGQDDLVVGLPVAGQPRLGEPGLVGHHADLLPLRARLDPSEPFAAHLARTGASLAEAAVHADCTLGRLLRQLDRPHDPARPPLAQVQFNLQRFPEAIDFGAGLRGVIAPAPKRFSTFELTVSLSETADGLTLDATYNRALFEPATIERWIGHYLTLLGHLARDPAQAVGRVPLLDAAERQTMLVAWNATETAHPLNVGALRAFRLHARRDPDRIAIRFGEETVSYGALDRWADRVAASLLDSALPERARVGLLMRRSPGLVAAMLGALRAGIPYVPLDPAMPPARRAGIVADAGIGAMLTLAADRALMPEAGPRVIEVDRLDGPAPTRFPRVPAERAAYLIYTSSTTGAPKGVEVLHRGLSNLLFSMARAPGLGRDDRLLAVTTVTFDIAGLELLLPLIRGAEIALASAEEARDGHALLARLERSEATVLQATPMTWRLLLEAGFRSRPGFKMLCGGEALPLDLARRLTEGGGELWNLYGPTETTIWSSAARVDPGEETVTVGRPIDNTSLFILDAQGEPVPVGVTGELLIGGVGLARGYLGRPDLTQRSFIVSTLPECSGARLYRTGDRARYRPDGRIEILGRVDHQIKLRGFRIEPGEIEAVLLRQTGLHAVVVLRPDRDGENRLVCYFVRSDGEAAPTLRNLRAALARELPDYMIPSEWVRLSALPLTASGKIDRKALPAPETRPSGFAEPAAAIPLLLKPAPEPVTTADDVLEATLAAIWREVLGLSVVAREDDLIALGADSLSMFRIVARARRENLPLGAGDLFQERTIARIAALLHGRLGEGGELPAGRAPIAPIRRPRPADAERAAVGQA
ncbi:non-ribosomal peptide synthetase [Methylobacterium sp. R2-1]|uniref:non-ribosomal peptide synthetase n=1 Tax=Methylobacterium sp. R2-1 TaxID=2587064 RepID=UPI00161FEB22|nr:non-ribosomal peptide synthetase [Methylobacterium sp. R2-1]MBB2962978.1 amino acid adenylation domain-containing protein [Methylobacterium sp. R2-1]